MKDIIIKHSQQINEPLKELKINKKEPKMQFILCSFLFYFFVVSFVYIFFFVLTNTNFYNTKKKNKLNEIQGIIVWRI